METKGLFEKFRNKKVLVLGDVMLDAYMVGQVSRISPEAPVPIVNLSKEEERLGGAANVALNLVSLGAQAIVCSVIGDDKEGKQMIELLQKAQISAAGIITSAKRKTTVKTRIIGNNQQLLRIDSEHTEDILELEEEQLFAKIKELISKGIDALIFEDYNKGTLTESLIKKVIELCREQNVITTVDPKKKNFFSYQGVTLFKPNLKELKEGLNISFSVGDEAAFEKAIVLLREKLKHQITFITLSERGVYISDEHNKFQIPAHVRNIADVSGAGDTVISVATLCLCAGLPIDQLAAISNLAGGIVCEKSGVVSINREELIEDITLLL